MERFSLLRVDVVVVQASQNSRYAQPQASGLSPLRQELCCNLVALSSQVLGASAGSFGGCNQATR
ncbi:hypothetical protein SD81_004335 [Tolypothrix campylonemoides VB511288]|nr:hypothetical protein SD81_004335 [Tolypothrix campylonemoides VB511288]